jgi:hypothetical protein
VSLFEYSAGKQTERWIYSDDLAIWETIFDGEIDGTTAGSFVGCGINSFAGVELDTRREGQMTGDYRRARCRRPLRARSAG